MTVTAIQGAVPAQTSPRTQTNTSALIDSDFETFLRMLTVQLQNQDPLDPIDNSEYAVQLATFSGVEQQVKTNDLLETLGSQLGVMGMSELAGWVGKQARANMPASVDAVRGSLGRPRKRPVPIRRNATSSCSAHGPG